jgi:GMP synthase PP-ATPase subunit
MEGVLQSFIALKNPLPQPGLNQRTLGPMASTVTHTQLREQDDMLLQNIGNHIKDYTAS